MGYSWRILVDMLFASLMQFFAAAPGCSKTFLGLKPWFHYLPTTAAPDCSIRRFNVLPNGSQSSDIPLVLLVLVDDLIRIAGLVAVIFIIYGGVQYATSQGNADQAQRAQSTIINALIGLVLAIIAVATVAFVGRAIS